MRRSSCCLFSLGIATARSRSFSSFVAANICTSSATCCALKPYFAGDGGLLSSPSAVITS